MGSLAVCELVKAWLEVVHGLMDARETAQRHLSAEEKKASAKVCINSCIMLETSLSDSLAIVSDQFVFNQNTLLVLLFRGHVKENRCWNQRWQDATNRSLI